MVATIINAYLPERTGDVLIIDDKSSIITHIICDISYMIYNICHISYVCVTYDMLYLRSVFQPLLSKTAIVAS